ncbi:hypothetical protein [Phycicoccus avicenniae]|uniref:hypothetical protein n=1 Tax=Phycicoccus avicenniae TaxID=2828860 RepID=UPI003D2D262F
MAVTTHNLFRFVNLRGTVAGAAIEPSQDTESSVMLGLLAGRSPSHLTPQEQKQILASYTPMTRKTQAALGLSVAADRLYRSRSRSPLGLSGLTVQIKGRNTTLAQFGRSPALLREQRLVYDAWLYARVSGRRREDLARLLRASAVLRALDTTDIGFVSRALTAPVTLPPGWLPFVRRRDAAPPPAPALVDVATHRTQLMARRAKVIRRISDHETIQHTAHQVMSGLAATPSQPPAGHRVRSSMVGGLLERAMSPGGPVVRATPVRAAPALDGAFYGDLDARLTSAQRKTLRKTLLRTGLPKPNSFGGLLDVLDPSHLIDEANQLCSQIRALDAVPQQDLPAAPPANIANPRSTVRGIGWGDLIVAREQLVGYQAREIAHVENVLAGESKGRRHLRKQRTEQVLEIDRLEETQTERDQQSTDRFELQTQSQKTIESDFKLDAGLNTSGRYGLTRVETNLDIGVHQSSSESRSSAQNLAKEVVNRAIERTREEVRERRRTTTVDEIRELNRHSIDNTTTGVPNPVPVSGIYLWLEKLHEVQLRHYGTRLMIEFHVSEPGVSLLEGWAANAHESELPPFDVGPTDVNEGNYLCLAERYAATEVEPPPPLYVAVGFTFASTPSEDVNEDTAEDVVADSIAVPEGYQPVWATALINAHPGHAEFFDIEVAVAGRELIAFSGVNADHESIVLDPQFWPNGVPITARAFGHFDKTMTLHVVLRCLRSPEALTKWRLRTWSHLRAGYEQLRQRQERAAQIAQANQTLGVQITGRPEADNRTREKDELKKWCIKAMRGKPFDFDHVVSFRGSQEPDPAASASDAPITRLFEDAFEWDQMNYFLYSYFWSRRSTWSLRAQQLSDDPAHQRFLTSGAARVIVPVTPGSEAAVLYYLDTDPAAVPEQQRVQGPVIEGVPPSETSFAGLWIELLTDRRQEVARGSGTLSVTNGSTSVTINSDSTWHADRTDLGREVFLNGDVYTVVAASDRALTLDRPYAGSTAARAMYAEGSVPYGPSWVATVPTSLTVLEPNRPALSTLP